jgi:hypothetical protein
MHCRPCHLTHSRPLQRPLTHSVALACHLRDVMPGNADVGQLTVSESIQLPYRLTSTQPATQT